MRLTKRDWNVITSAAYDQFVCKGKERNNEARGDFLVQLCSVSDINIISLVYVVYD